MNEIGSYISASGGVCYHKTTIWTAWLFFVFFDCMFISWGRPSTENDIYHKTRMGLPLIVDVFFWLDAVGLDAVGFSVRSGQQKAQARS